MVTPTLAGLRRYAVARTLPPPERLDRIVARLGFVQADPIRSPARAQDLTLRHRAGGYHAGDLERAYAALDVEEDFFVNYGFVPRRVWRLMHPRASLGRVTPARRRLMEALLAFVRERGEAHPRAVDTAFAHGSVVNYWGGSSNATTALLDDMHYRGLLRVARRERGVRVYAVHEHDPAPSGIAERRARLDALIDVLVGLYAPVPSSTLAWLANRLRIAVPQWRSGIPHALARARKRLGRARVDGVDWYWPPEESPAEAVGPDDEVRLLAPFDPLVWDRKRFEHFWGWPYRFEAYTPAARRRWGYYALPLLWRDRVVGWANVSVGEAGLEAEVGYAAGRRPAGPEFAGALERERSRMASFLGVPAAAGTGTGPRPRRRA